MSERDIEELSKEVHKLYCKQYFIDKGCEYWTKGDYSLLPEEVKEYDRNIARFILADRKATVQKVVGPAKNWFMNKESSMVDALRKTVELAEEVCNG